jgi:hypothetical protein
MKTNPIKLKLHQPAHYRICVQGTLDATWSNYFADLTVVNELDASLSGITILTGQLTDQAMLLGVLNRLYCLGLSLRSVEWLIAE